MSQHFTRFASLTLALSALATTAGAQTMTSTSMSPAPAPLLPSEAKFLRSFDDANIIAHLVATDSVEMSMAQAAIRQSKSDEVLAYAKSMLAEHGQARMADRQIARKSGIAPALIVGEMKKSHMGASIDSVDVASNLTVDRHYMLSQVEMHQHMLAELETLRGVAKNADLRAHIDAEIPKVREHLAKAHEIAVTKGFESKQKS